MKLALLYNKLRSLIIPLEQIDKSLPSKGTIADLGCGQGVIAKYIAQNGQRNIIGVDLNKKRLPKTFLKNLRFQNGNIMNFNLRNIDGVIMSDVLHHITYNEQNKLIGKIAKSLKKGRIFVIKEIDTGEFFRSRMSRFWDFVFYPNEKIFFRNSKELAKTLEKSGFKVKIKRLMRFFPGSTTLFICTKK